MSDKMKKSLFAFYGIWAAAVLLIIFIVPTEKTRADIGMILFFVLAAAVSCGITYMGFNKDGLISKIYGLPMWQIAARYCGIQTVVTLIFVFKHYPVWIGAVISVILLAAALIGAMAAENARDMIAGVDAGIKDSVRRVKMLYTTAQSLAADCEDAEAKEMLEKLSEELRYSDPVSVPEVSGLEDDMESGLEEIGSMIENKNYDGITEKIKAVQTLSSKRNTACKTAKSP